MLEHLLILPLALAIDLMIGEYPGLLHPVVWLGKVISLQLKLAPGKGNKSQFIYGMLIVLLNIALFSVSVYFLLYYIRGVSTIAYVIVAAILLKSTFSFRELYQSAERVKRLLTAGKIEEARRETGYLVSRNTETLDQEHLISAVVEMEAESTTDSWMAPLFYWLLLGVPGALAYRVVNTFDSMIGYHGEYEYLGKFAARLDDILNYIPARLSGLLLVMSAYLGRINGHGALHLMLSDHKKTESPNAGWAMSAVAGALDVQLEKPGHYQLGIAGKPLALSSISTTLRLMVISSVIWSAVCIGITGIYYALTS